MWWGELEEHFALQIPEALKRAYDAGEAKDWPFALLPFEEILELSELGPSTPMRFLPISHGANGDQLGLYFPRGAQARPFAVIHYLTNCILDPLSANSEVIVLDPDQFDVAFEGQPESLDLGAFPEWESLVVNLESPTPSMELLKPLSLNVSMLDRLGDADLGRLAGRLARLEPQSLAAQVFSTGLDICRTNCWIKFADELLDARRYRAAACAFDNALRMLFSYPHHGYPGENRDNFEAAHEIFQRLRELSDRLDRFDQRVIVSQCENYDEWMREAREDQ